MANSIASNVTHIKQTEVTRFEVITNFLKFLLVLVKKRDNLTFTHFFKHIGRKVIKLTFLNRKINVLQFSKHADVKRILSHNILVFLLT
jgi:hypothetical protein